MTLTLELLRSLQKKDGDVAALKLLATEGKAFDQSVAPDLRNDVARVVEKTSLFRKCIAVAAEWAGFVKPSPDWRDDAVRYLCTGAPFVRLRYSRSFHGDADPFAYLDTWSAVLNDTGQEPDVGCTATQLLKFEQECFAVLSNLEWRKERHWLGPWTFHAAFKIFLLHEQALWVDPRIDAIALPTGGESGRYSFERGWEGLQALGLVTALPSSTSFLEGVRRATQAHAQVLSLAARAGSRAVHLNSAVYVLGSEG